MAARVGQDRLRIRRVDPDEDRVPAAGPAEARDRTRNAGRCQRGPSVVGFGHGSVLDRPEGGRSVLADLLDRLGVVPRPSRAGGCADRRTGRAATRAGVRVNDVGQALGADVPRPAVADPVLRLHLDVTSESR